jgi:hypothetical protein
LVDELRRQKMRRQVGLEKATGEIGQRRAVASYLENRIMELTRLDDSPFELKAII